MVPLLLWVGACEPVSVQTYATDPPGGTYSGPVMVSFIIPNEELRARFSHEVQSGHFYMGNIFGTVAMETAYQEGADWLEQLLSYLKNNMDLLVDFTESNLPGISIRSPEATYLAWMDMKNLGMRSKELRKFMVHEAKIGCNDGPSFGPGGAGYQRLNFACPRSTLKKALDQLKQAVDKIK